MMETARAFASEIARRLDDPALIEQLAPAVQAISDTVLGDGLVYVFGTGHSHLLALDLHYRAGGPAFVVPVLDEALMLHNGAVASTERERTPGVAQDVFANYPISSKDAVIVISNSGVNAVPMEFAALTLDCGATLIALTSREYSSAAARGRPTLSQVADIVIDNFLPPGDALATLPGTALRAGPGSTAVGSTLLHALFAEAAARLADKGAPPIFLSANMPGAEDNNRGLIARYLPRNQHL